MSNPFISPADASWQTLLDEITTAYSERRQAISQSAYTATDDKDVQVASYWATLQNWLETNCVSFIDHVSGPINPAGTAFLYFTLATFRSAAGLNASGFRRVPDGVEWDGVSDPVWSYGQMQTGDIIGPWIFEDLQKGFGALKWTLEPGAVVSCLARHGHGDTIEEMNAEWDSESWVPSASRIYEVQADLGSVQQRIRGLARVSPPTHRPCAKVAYVFFAGDAGPSHHFVDLDGLGATTLEYFLLEEIAESSDATVTTSVFNAYYAATEAPWRCFTPSESQNFSGIAISPEWLLKWNFTNV